MEIVAKAKLAQKTKLLHFYELHTVLGWFLYRINPSVECLWKKFICHKHSAEGFILLTPNYIHPKASHSAGKPHPNYPRVSHSSCSIIRAYTCRSTSSPHVLCGNTYKGPHTFNFHGNGYRWTLAHTRSLHPPFYHGVPWRSVHLFYAGREETSCGGFNSGVDKKGDKHLGGCLDCVRRGEREDSWFQNYQSGGVSVFSWRYVSC